MQAGCKGLIQISVEFSTEYLGSLLFQFFASLNNCLGFLLLMMNFFLLFYWKRIFIHYILITISLSQLLEMLPTSLPTQLYTLFSNTHAHTKLKVKNPAKIKTRNHNIQTKNQYDKKNFPGTAMWDKKSTKILLSSISFWPLGMGLLRMWLIYLVRAHSRKLIFPLSVAVNFR